MKCVCFFMFFYFEIYKTQKKKLKMCFLYLKNLVRYNFKKIGINKPLMFLWRSNELQVKQMEIEDCSLG